MKRYLSVLALIIVSAVVFSGFLFNDDSRLTSFLEKFEQYTERNPQEKVHLHFDKPYYSLGDEIWFSAYVVNAEQNKLSVLSKVLYVDVLDEHHVLKKTLTLPLENGLGDGNIDLTDTIFKAGSYQFRAYTNWMRNFDDAFLFRKQILVGDALREKVLVDAQFDVAPKANETVLNAILTYTNLKNEAQTNKEVSYDLLYKDKKLFSGTGRTNEKGVVELSYNLKKEYALSNLLLNITFRKNEVIKIVKSIPVVNQGKSIDLQFFPEGGNLVNGIRSKVAFKAIDESGLGTEVEGYVEDQNGQKVAVISSEHLGMGLFAFTPMAGQQYTAVIVKDGNKQTYKLPKANETGYVLSLNHLNDDELLLKLSASPQLVAHNELVVVAQSNGLVKYTTKIKVDKADVSYKLPKNKLDGGIVQFTIFTPDMNPLAERLVFIRQRDSLQLKMEASKAAYAKRAPVDLSLHVVDANAKGQVGSFSVAVVHQDKVGAAEENELTIWSNLLLTSDLKGYVEKPNYYFTAVDATKNKHLDLLMLTQGWRRFKWTDILQEKPPAFKFQPESSFTIRGTIVNLLNKPIPRAKINLFVPSTLLLIDTVADADGRFVFDDLVFPDTATVILRAKNAKDRNNAQILIDNKVGFSSSLVPKAEGMKDAVFVKYLYAAQQRFDEMGKFGLVDGSILLKPVEIKTSRNPPIYKSQLPAISPPDYTLTPDKLQTSGNVLMLLHGLGGVNIRNNIIYGRNKQMEGPMLLLLDGNPIKDVSMIDPSNLAGIQIVRGGAYAAGIGLNLREPQDATVNAPRSQYVSNVMSSAYGIVFFTTDWRPKVKSSVGFSRLRTGYSLTKEFYAPAYDVPDQDRKMVDLRSTIYWKPNLITDQNGNASMRFFTADEPGKYLVTVEGIALSGKLVRKSYTIAVK